MLTPSKTRQILENLDHKPRHRFGQNFLVDSNIVKKSLELAQFHAGDVVIEIGPGLGTLTRALLEQSAIVYAVEIDAKLAQYLQDELMPFFADRFHLKAGDALAYPLANLPSDIDDFKVVANLPYSISTPWLDAVLVCDTLPKRMVLMLQREAADRFAANAGSKDFGAITIFLQSAYSVQQGHAVSAKCFYPVPQVDSYLFHLELKQDPYRFLDISKQLIRNMFTQRRKQIGSICKGQQEIFKPILKYWLEYLKGQGLDEKVRPDEIDIYHWQQLDSFIKQKGDLFFS